MANMSPHPRTADHAALPSTPPAQAQAAAANATASTVGVGHCDATRCFPIAFLLAFAHFPLPAEAATRPPPRGGQFV